MEPLPSLDSVLAKLQAQGIHLPPGPTRLDGYGDSAALSEELLGLIRQGRKRAGTSLLWAMQAANEAVPAAGTIEIVLDHHSEPALITRITSVAVVAYAQVTAGYAAIEGEGDASLDHWRSAHWAFFSRECKRIGREPAQNMPVVCSVFELLGVLPARAAAGRRKTAEAMHVLYGSRGSGSATTELALRACGLPFRSVRASTWEPDSARAELARVNPLGQIPTLVLPDGGVLTESAAILIHLGLTHPQSSLLPAAPSARAQAIRGLVFIAANCYAAISIADYPERWTTASTKPAQEKVRQGARRQLHRHWEIFADTFKAQPFFNGAAPGALDFSAAVVSKWSGTRQHLAKARPAFLETLKRIETQESVEPVFREHWES